jgi:hypothetical protein
VPLVYPAMLASPITILQAHACNALLHASYAFRSSHKRLSTGPMGRIFRILQMNFREFQFYELE